MKKLTLIFFLVSISIFLQGQSLDDLESYSVDEFYKKIELGYGTLDENGDEISYVFIKSDLDEGTYEIELTDGPGDLYEIKDTDVYISFNNYFGYAGYGTNCILKVESGYYNSIVYKLE